MDGILKFLGQLAPAIGTALGGPIGPIAGLAIKAVSSALGLDPATATKEDVLTAVQNASPEQLAAVRATDQQFQKDMAQLGVDVFKLEVEDKKDARATFGKDRGVFWLGVMILLTFAVVVGGASYGAYALLTGGMAIKDVGIVAAVFGFLGTIIGYVAANAQQVVGYFFGSSRDASSNSQAMSSAFSKLGAR